MSIPFTQYVRPDGHRRYIDIARSEATEAKAQQIIAAGLVFECEELTTGHASFTITDPEKGDLAIEVCRNGPDVPAAVDRLIEKFDLSKPTPSEE